jgi:hypothetical protein
VSAISANAHGRLLASVGDLVKADLFLERLNSVFRAISASVRTCRSTSPSTLEEAFRIAPAIMAIPQQFRCDIRLDVYTLFYPRSIRTNSCRSGQIDIDPLFISGLIRQVSPSTRRSSPRRSSRTNADHALYRQISCRKDGCDFCVDSLLQSAVQLRRVQRAVTLVSVRRVAGSGSCRLQCGPHYAKRWEKQNWEDEFDLFVEDFGLRNSQICQESGELLVLPFPRREHFHSYSKGGQVSRPGVMLFP